MVSESIKVPERQVISMRTKHRKRKTMMLLLIALNCSLLILVSLVLTAAGNYIYQNSIEEQSFANSMEIQSQVQKSLDLIFQGVSENLKILGETPSLQTYLKISDDTDESDRLNREVDCRDALLQFTKNHSEYLSVLLAGENGEYVSNDSYRIQKKSLLQENWYAQAFHSDGALALNSSIVGRNLRAWRNYSIGSFLSVSQAVKDTGTGKILGVLQMDLNIESISNLVKDITMGQTGFGYIMDSAGKVLYSPQNSVVYRINPKWMTDSEDEQGQLRCLINGKQYNLIYSRSAYTGLIAAGVFDWGETVKSAASIRKISAIIAVIVAAIAVAASMFFSASVTKPLTELSELMTRAKEGDLTVHFDNHYSGEVGELGDAFNSMTEQTNNLIGLVKKEQQDKREAELRILHEQIKPHFLYNTLDTIQWMAKDYNATDIIDIVHSLSRFFRISLSQGKEMITIAEEVEMVRNYLEIQKCRYEDLFEFEIQIVPEILNCRIIRLSLQPLVENALYHGIKESEKDTGLLLIRGQIDPEKESDILLEVEDDGAGMSDERLDELNGWLSSKDRGEDVTAYAILNVNDRIRIMYGDGYGLRLRKREGGGTISRLRIHK